MSRKIPKVPKIRHGELVVDLDPPFALALAGTIFACKNKEDHLPHLRASVFRAGHCTIMFCPGRGYSKIAHDIYMEGPITSVTRVIYGHGDINQRYYSCAVPVDTDIEGAGKYLVSEFFKLALISEHGLTVERQAKFYIKSLSFWRKIARRGMWAV